MKVRFQSAEVHLPGLLVGWRARGSAGDAHQRKGGAAM